MMTTQTDTQAQLKIMVEPVDHQELHDQVSAMALLGKIPWYAAKDCLECGDWDLAERLIAEGAREGEEAK